MHIISVCIHRAYTLCICVYVKFHKNGLSSMTRNFVKLNPDNIYIFGIYTNNLQNKRVLVQQPVIL